MIPHVVMLQPIGGGAGGENTAPSVQPSEPTQPAPGQVIAPSDGDAGVGTALPGGEPAQPVQTAASQELCEKANGEATLATLGYGLGASMLALLIFVILEKKLVSSRGGRLAAGLTIGSVLASVLAYVDPARGDQFKLCLNDPVNAIYLTLGTQPVARALAFGLTPTLGLTLVLCLVARRFV